MKKKKIAKFKIAYETRKLELELFWKRYSVFWTVTGAVFIAYGFSKESLSQYSFLIACFGIITSYAWFLINRGNKYWQETWEKRVHENERFLMFRKWESIQKKGFWGGARYSVSKIAIILSYFVFVFWIIISVYDLVSLTNFFIIENGLIKKYLSYLFIILFLFSGLLILEIKGRTSVKVEDKFGKKLVSLKKKGKNFILESESYKKLSDKKIKKIIKDSPKISLKNKRNLFNRMPKDVKQK